MCFWCSISCCRCCREKDDSSISMAVNAFSYLWSFDLRSFSKFATCKSGGLVHMWFFGVLCCFVGYYTADTEKVYEKGFLVETVFDGNKPGLPHVHSISTYIGTDLNMVKSVVALDSTRSNIVRILLPLSLSKSLSLPRALRAPLCSPTLKHCESIVLVHPACLWGSCEVLKFSWSQVFIYILLCWPARV